MRVCPLRVARSWPLSASHSLIVRSELPEASVFPFGLKATEETWAVRPLSVARSWPLAASNNLISPLKCNLGSSQRLQALAEARVLPSGLKATEVTQSVCPLSVARSWPLAASHNLIVWSSLPEATVLPSGLKD